jgi:hypothetical protein
MEVTEVMESEIIYEEGGWSVMKYYHQPSEFVYQIDHAGCPHLPLPGNGWVYCSDPLICPWCEEKAPGKIEFVYKMAR